MRNYHSRLRACSMSSFGLNVAVFCFSILAVCLFSSNATADISPEQLHTTNLLMPHLTGLLQDSNILNGPLATAEFQPRWLIPRRINPFLAGLSDTASVNFAAQVGQNSVPSSLNILEDPNGPEDYNHGREPLGQVPVYRPMRTEARRRIERQLWHLSISPPESKDDKKNEDELRQLIRQIYSIELQPRSKIAEPVINVEPTPRREVIPRHLWDPEERRRQCRAGVPLPEGFVVEGAGCGALPEP